MTRRNLLRFTRCAAVLAIALAGCSFSIGGEDPGDAAARLIEDELAETIGLGPIDATCESPELDDVGTTWACTGLLEDGADAGTIEFMADIDEPDHVNVETTNLIVGSQVVLLAEEAASTLSGIAGFDLPADAVDCGTESIILPASNEMPCAVTIDGETIDTTIEITDLDNTAFEVDTVPLGPALTIPSLQLTAKNIIEGELADAIGLGPVMATCERPTSADADTTWTCTGSVDGQTAEYIAVTDGDDNVNVNTTNVILADQVDIFAAAAMQQLNQLVGTSLPDEAMDCGDLSIIMNASLDFICALDAGSEGIYDATITVTDPTTGAFTVIVADTPRG